MAECSYARCLQERRLIKRELMKWSKNMVFIVGLERVAEELMGRRKWKLYQEVLARSQLNLNQNISARQNKKSNSFQHSERDTLIIDQQNTDQSHLKKNEISAIKKEIEENFGEENCTSAVTKEENQEGKLAESSISNSRTINTNITVKPSESSSTSSPAVAPIDWKPNEKCYFCVDGKLLTVNEKGELVAESGPASSEAELAHRTSVDSDSDSSDSSPDLELRNQSASAASAVATAAAAAQIANVHKTLTSRLRDSLPPNMTSFESMGAQMAAVASIQGLQSGLSSFYPGIWYHQLAQQLMSATTTTSSETPAAESSPSIKDSPSPSDTVGEQPLDLSAKPSPNSSTSGDQKQIFRAKPRMTTISGRRTYTEDNLHSALQDIISGKLGTRRAAVLYGIPRSTLRNKVYKISLEQKRETSSLHQPTLDELVDQDEEDKDISGDEEKDEKLIGSSLLGQSDDLARITQSQLTSQLAAAAFQKLSKGCDSSSLDLKPSTSLDAQTKIQSNVTQQQQHQHQQQQLQQQQQPPQTPPITANPWLDPNVLFQSLLLTGGLSGIPGLLQPKIEDPAAIRELFSNWMVQQDELIKEHMKNTAATANDMLANSKAAIDPRILLQNLPGLQQHQQSQHALHHGYQSRLPKSDTPETASSVDISEASDDPSVILKIPSFKPVAGSSSSGKNGENLSSPASQVTPPILSRSPQQTNNIPRISPTLVRQNSESQSPPIICLRDVIANSLSRTFSQQGNKDTHSNTLKGSSSIESNEQFKRASISVIKNIGGTDISRFATTPNILANNINNSSQVGCNNSANAGGKGTRPKRGKYRNYDRDSLVEAVKAVQRGEMSVHRAGSYYGVPHSTLEYKVKERHLMRPRKREPKPQPLDDRAGSSNNSSVSTKNTNIPSISAVSSLDKLKTSATTQKPSIKNNPPFPSTSPNGMKVPLFDQAMTAQFQYAPHLFWPHSTGFGTLPIDFQRPPAGTAPPTFPSNAEGYLATQMMQRFHEESSRLSGNNLSSTSTTTTTTTTSNSVTNTKPTNSGTNSNVKSTRQIAESLYDSGGANGSFLDGIIRQTLDRKTTDIPHGALLDQLVKNTRPLSSSSLEQQLSSSTTSVAATTTAHQTKTKRPGSPVHYPVIDIKRERSSPVTIVSSDIDRNPIDCDFTKESAESLMKIREGIALKMEDKQQQQLAIQHHHTAALHLLQQQQQQLQQQQQQQQQQLSGNSIRHLSIEDLNGGGSSGSIHDKLGQIKTELEDSL